MWNVPLRFTGNVKHAQSIRKNRLGLATISISPVRFWKAMFKPGYADFSPGNGQLPILNAKTRHVLTNVAGCRHKRGCSHHKNVATKLAHTTTPLQNPNSHAALKEVVRSGSLLASRRALSDGPEFCILYNFHDLNSPIWLMTSLSFLNYLQTLLLCCVSVSFTASTCLFAADDVAN